MKKNYIVAFLSLCIGTGVTLNANSGWDRIKSALSTSASWVGSTLPSTDTTWEVTKRLARKPTTWAAIGATGYGTYALGQAINSPKNAAMAVGGVVGLTTLWTFKHWMDLRTQYLHLCKQQTNTSNPYIRNVWYNPVSEDGELFKDGHDIITDFINVDQKGQHIIKQSFLKQLNVSTDVDAIQEIEIALHKIKDDLTLLRKDTTIQYELASSLGLSSPDELLTSDSLLNVSMENDLRPVFDRATEFGLYSIRLDWKERFHIPFPALYTWNYGMASKCVWVMLGNYSLLKAIRKVLQTPILGDYNRHKIPFLKY